MPLDGALIAVHYKLLWLGLGHAVNWLQNNCKNTTIITIALTLDFLHQVSHFFFFCLSKGRHGACNMLIFFFQVSCHKSAHVQAD